MRPDVSLAQRVHGKGLYYRIGVKCKTAPKGRVARVGVLTYPCLMCIECATGLPQPHPPRKRISMNRIDVHCHFIPSLDDGCQSITESLACLRIMVAHGYTRLFCTPHCGASEFTDLTVPEVAE